MKLRRRVSLAGSRRQDEMDAQRDPIAALDSDVDRQLAAAGSASASISNRASILIAAAGLTSGVQVSSQLALSAVLAALAALVGVALLLMRTAREVPILEAETKFWAQPPVVALRNLMHWKNGVLLDLERSLRRRRIVLVIGFALLSASIAWGISVSLITALTGGGE